MTIVSKQKSVARNDKGYWQRQSKYYLEKSYNNEDNEGISSYYKGVSDGIKKVLFGGSIY